MTTHPIMIFEPLGARELLTPVRLGADETLDVRVPDNDPTRFLTFDQLAGRWVCRATGSGITLNALALESEETHSLQDGDVLRLGDSVIRVALSGKELALQVEHLEGNLTLAPVITATGLQFDEQAEEIITASVRAKADSAQDVENTTRINQRFI